MPRRTMLILAGALIAAFLFGLWLLLGREPEVPADAKLISALANISAVDAYTQTVMTETDVSGRTLNVEGVYHLDRRNLRFASSATTTLVIPDIKTPQVFNLMNVSIAEDVYVKIETEDKALREKIPHSPEWRHFSRSSVPDAFADIAVAGPILDNLLLFDKNGAYLRLIQNHGSVKWGDEELLRYTFERADDAPTESGGTLETLLERIGEGTVDAWIDMNGTGIRYMVVTNGTYHSTTTFSNINHIPSINSPALAID